MSYHTCLLSIPLLCNYPTSYHQVLIIVYIYTKLRSYRFKVLSFHGDLLHSTNRISTSSSYRKSLFDPRDSHRMQIVARIASECWMISTACKDQAVDLPRIKHSTPCNGVLIHPPRTDIWPIKSLHPRRRCSRHCTLD